ncbi:hypothetical protein A4G18_04270 [Pasteurellaceae bacterium Pebbles2]|nr:hypothetical protein [Pasteurellaceae bacterium Pebbles2]
MKFLNLMINLINWGIFFHALCGVCTYICKHGFSTDLISINAFIYPVILAAVSGVLAEFCFNKITRAEMLSEIKQNAFLLFLTALTLIFYVAIYIFYRYGQDLDLFSSSIPSEYTAFIYSLTFTLAKFAIQKCIQKRNNKR